jgi:uncharacterized protein
MVRGKMNIDLWIIWLITTAGACKLLAAAENCVHGWALSRPSLQRIRGVHNFLLVSYPVVTAAALMFGTRSMVSTVTNEPAGLARSHIAFSSPSTENASHVTQGPQPIHAAGTVNPSAKTGLLLSSASLETAWNRVPTWVQPLWMFGAIGFSILIHSTWRNLTYRPPACETQSSTVMLDLRRGEIEPLVGDGRARWLARLPMNQQFSLAVHHRTYVLPTLPKSWDGVSIAHFSDVHFRGPVRLRYFEKVMAEVAAMQCDIIAFTGDLLDDKRCLSWVGSTLGTLKAPWGCYFVLGNHDWYLPITSEIRQELTSHGWQDLAGRVHVLNQRGECLVLAGNEQPWMGSLPEFPAEHAHEFRLVLSHGPDQITWARQQNVQLMLAGHTHGGQIRLPVIGPVYSPSRYGCRFASGVFLQSPTLLSVTRGVSGREPIRYRCAPEIIRLTLRRGTPPTA